MYFLMVDGLPEGIAWCEIQAVPVPLEAALAAVGTGGGRNILGSHLSLFSGSGLALQSHVANFPRVVHEETHLRAPCSVSDRLVWGSGRKGPGGVGSRAGSQVTELRARNL